MSEKDTKTHGTVVVNLKVGDVVTVGDAIVQFDAVKGKQIRLLVRAPIEQRILRYHGTAARNEVQGKGSK